MSTPLTVSASSAVLPASRVRYGVVALMLSLAVITYVDRVCISRAAPLIRDEFGLGPKQMGWVFSIFTLAYALFEIPGGRAGDRFGPRSVLMKVVVMWSLFTAATGWAWNYVSLLACRFFFGVGEAGCFPNVTKVFSIWLPSSERARGQGLLWLAARWGGAATPPLVAALIMALGWRWTFVVFGAVGVVWAVVFYRWFRDRPQDHPDVNFRELAMLDGAESNRPSHAPAPWGRLLSHPSVLLLWLQYFSMGYGWYFYITWLPTYLHDARGLPLDMRSAMLTTLPLFVGGIGCFVGGWLARSIGHACSNVALGRRVVAFVGLASAAAMLVWATRISHPVVALFALAAASFANDLAMAPGWTACMDVGGRHAGVVSGGMNMVGNFGGMLGPLVVGYVLHYGRATPDAAPSLESWTTAFLITATIYALGAIAWLFIDPVTPVETEADKPGSRAPGSDAVVEAEPV